jgi:hypothetical protein
VIRVGFSGLAIKFLQAEDPEDVLPNKPAKGSKVGLDLYCYVENWDSFNQLYDEFKSKGAKIAIEPWMDQVNSPWKEFAIYDLDYYCIVFGGTNKSNPPKWRLGY